MDDFPSVGPADVAVFWDYENVRIPAWCPATAASEGIRNKVAKYGRIVEKRLYYDSRQPTEYMAPRSELDLSGFTLVDCPSRNRKETLDKKLIVDVLCFAWERASLGAKACVVLITSDGDYSYALARLRDIGVFTVIIYRPANVAKVLIDNANVAMSWEYDVLSGPPPGQDEDEDDDLESVTGNSSTLVESVAATNDTTTTPLTAPSSDRGTPDEASDHSAKKPAKQPNTQTRGKFALFCSVVLNAQHRNVQEGISVYSSWAAESITASTFYVKVGEKDRESYLGIRTLAPQKGFVEYLDIRTLAPQKGFVEWGRRNLNAPGKPVIKVKDRDDRAEYLSSESYLRLTYSGLSVVNPNTETKENDWKMILPKASTKEIRQGDTPVDGSVTSSANGGGQTPAPKSRRVFVGGLVWQTTEDSLRSHFKQFGPLQNVVVFEGRGFAFVFFRNPDDAERCLNKAGQHFVDNKSVDVKLYQKS
eukprot:CAMPEP_0201904342 /NCGR_PEP_ID=MMETSP0902-20130614/55946_1 /ASSEMBLY_ACC=CAM_ASM_000551 /TAXON_ID=420261 /ORGANISM="Thalassiosira antarctica, Strain CCMP982" /LENGTH=476 /DNA_ID=CAMNT_0048438425 /DNA_START=48 /DNA_END=1478 /DNA_ORIENTATION=-